MAAKINYFINAKGFASYHDTEPKVLRSLRFKADEDSIGGLCGEQVPIRRGLCRSARARIGTNFAGAIFLSAK